jgi:hypothetical protein
MDYLAFGHYVSSIPPNAKFDFSVLYGTTLPRKSGRVYTSTNAITVVAPVKLRWAGHSRHDGNKMYTNILAGKREEMLHHYVLIG